PYYVLGTYAYNWLFCWPRLYSSWQFSRTAVIETQTSLRTPAKGRNLDAQVHAPKYYTGATGATDATRATDATTGRGRSRNSDLHRGSHLYLPILARARWKKTPDQQFLDFGTWTEQWLYCDNTTRLYTTIAIATALYSLQGRLPSLTSEWLQISIPPVASLQRISVSS
ncbi:hypothetical protein G9P44_001925, partial [Scheffersomyces stipitis]